jgi:DNA topoisomerase-1
MKYSTLTKEELRESFTNLLPNLDFALVEAGLTRHEVDWLYGINLSRALTNAVKYNSSQYATLSTGRVQGPTLKFTETREKSIQTFVPTPYWRVTAKIQIDRSIRDAEYEKTLETLTDAQRVKARCKTKQGQVGSVKVTVFEKNPPVPFDLGALQSEAYRVFRYSPTRTLGIAQRLYLDALISYPRTSSQKLPSSIGYQNILNKLSKSPIYFNAASELLSKPILKPNEGKKFDTAHPAIYPTGNLPDKPLVSSERNVFDLVVKRFFSVFGEPPLLQSIEAKISLNGNIFLFGTERNLTEGWMNLYKPYIKSKEASLPSLTEGQKVDVKLLALNSHFSNPPARYNPRSLLEQMEKEEIGTKATRATTIQTLLERKYLSGTNKLAVTNLGLEVTAVLSKYCPIIVSPEFTRRLEHEMESIQEGTQTKRAVIRTALKTLKLVTSELKENEITIGTQLNLALRQARTQERTVGTCPKCVDGKLVILRSKKSGKRFVGCTNYFQGKCNTAFPLPQTGSLKWLGICKSCSSPIITVYSRGKNPLQICINPNCPQKESKK